MSTLLHRVTKLIHEQCKDAPHDIGLQIVELIENEMFANKGIELKMISTDGNKEIETLTFSNNGCRVYIFFDERSGKYVTMNQFADGKIEAVNYSREGFEATSLMMAKVVRDNQ